MPERRIVLLAAGVFVLLVTGCTTKTQPQMDSTPKEEASVPDTAKGEPLRPAGKQRVTLYVEGMTKVQGITWLTWPNGVKEALLGLPGIASLEVDLKKDQFRITYDPDRVTPERMLEAVRKQGFRGEIVKDASGSASGPGKVHRDLARLPEALRKDVQKARQDGKPLLLAFHGPGWLACKRMDTVTYPNDQVKQELSHWALLKVDIAEHSNVAELFEVAGIPVAVAITAAGEELGRIENFVEPAEFRARLTQLRPRQGPWLYYDLWKWRVPMLGRVFAIALLGAVPILGSGCPCCSSAADEPKTVHRAALGAETRVPTADEAKAYQLDKLVGKIQGQYIIAVEKDGPAAKAGLKVGDVLLSLDANKVFSRDDIDDLLRVSTPDSKVKALVKRADTPKEETVTVALGATKVEDKGQQFTWQYAGSGQLDAALAAAKKDSKPVLVGLSGADTWWPTTRFEGGPLSQILDDPAVLKASEKFVRVIVRRPHAYEFRQKFKGQEVPIPGVIVLDADGKLVASSSLDSAKEVAEKLNGLGK